MSRRLSWILGLWMSSGCGRLWFDPLGDDGDDGAINLAIVDVRPAWSMPEGGVIEVELAGDVAGAAIAIDGLACADAVSSSPTTVTCSAPAHDPATVPLVATNGNGDTASYARKFVYLTPGMYQLGGPFEDNTSGVAIDADGNVFVSGGTRSDLDGPNAGDFDALLVKYDASGQVAWVHTLGTPTFDYARDVAVDPSGAATIVGFSDGDLDGMGGGGGNDIFVARFASDGALAWLTELGTAGDDQSWDLAVDSAGNTVLAGWTDGAFSPNAGALDYVIARLDATGAVDWIRQAGTAADDHGHSITAAPDGTAYLVGYTAGALDGASAGGVDLFVARYDVDGTRAWLRQRGSPGDDLAQDATTANGDVWVAGYTTGALDGNSSAGAQDVFAMRFDAGGAWALTRTHGSAASENSWGIAVAPSGTVYLSCITNGAFAGQSNAGGSNDFCMVAMDRDGNHAWTRIVGTPAYEGSSSCAIDVGRTGLVYISLITDTSLDGMPNRGGNDIAVAKLDALGALR